MLEILIIRIFMTLLSFIFYCEMFCFILNLIWNSKKTVAAGWLKREIHNNRFELENIKKGILRSTHEIHVDSKTHKLVHNRWLRCPTVEWYSTIIDNIHIIFDSIG